MGQAPTCLINTIQSFFKYSFEKYWKQYRTKFLTLKKRKQGSPGCLYHVLWDFYAGLQKKNGRCITGSLYWKGLAVVLKVKVLGFGGISCWSNPLNFVRAHKFGQPHNNAWKMVILADWPRGNDRCFAQLEFSFHWPADQMIQRNQIIHKK